MYVVSVQREETLSWKKIFLTHYLCTIDVAKLLCSTAKQVQKFVATVTHKFAAFTSLIAGLKFFLTLGQH
jgi:hypothetical protein